LVTVVSQVIGELETAGGGVMMGGGSPSVPFSVGLAAPFAATEMVEHPVAKAARARLHTDHSTNRTNRIQKFLGEKEGLLAL
jgi:hypothetical protein